MLKKFKADLHIHSCLSPCADIDMTPKAIVNSAIDRGMDIIAITDHNSAENILAARKAAANKALTVLGGMEITSSEEVHILALFEDTESIIKLQDTVYSTLVAGENDEKRFGEQIVVNEKDEVMDFNRRLLIGATSLSADQIINNVHSLGGLSIASHIDRDAFSIISQLGFIPDNLGFDALEISPGMNKEKAEEVFRDYKSYMWISSSDAHNSENIGSRTTDFFMHSPTIEELKLALKHIDGRKAEWK